EKWLDSCVEAYELPEASADGGTLGQRAAVRVRRRAEDISRVLRHALKICEEPDGPYMYADMLESDLEGIERLGNTAEFRNQYDIVHGFVWKRLSGKKDDTVSP